MQKLPTEARYGRGRNILAAGAVLTLLLAPSAAQAQQPVELDLVGDIAHPQDQAMTSLTCPGDSFVQGLQVRQGDWLDSVQLICANVNKYGRVVGGWMTSAVAGGTGGTHAAQLVCPGHLLVFGLGGLMTTISRGVPGILGGGRFRYLADPVIYCGPSPLADVNESAGHMSHAAAMGRGAMGIRDPQFVKSSSDTFYDDSVRQDCPTGYAAKSIRVSIDLQFKTIKAIGLNCVQMPHEPVPPSGARAGEDVALQVSPTGLPAGQQPAPPPQGFCIHRPSACSHVPGTPAHPPTIPNQPHQ